MKSLPLIRRTDVIIPFVPSDVVVLERRLDEGSSVVRRTAPDVRIETVDSCRVFHQPMAAIRLNQAVRPPHLIAAARFAVALHVPVRWIVNRIREVVIGLCMRRSVLAVIKCPALAHLNLTRRAVNQKRYQTTSQEYLRRK